MFVVVLLGVCLCRRLWCSGCVNSVVINKLKLNYLFITLSWLIGLLLIVGFVCFVLFIVVLRSCVCWLIAMLIGFCWVFLVNSVEFAFALI